MGASHLVKTKRTLTDELPTGRPMCIQFIPGELRALLLAALVGVHAVRLDGAEAAVDVLAVQPAAVGAAERGAGRTPPGKPEKVISLRLFSILGGAATCVQGFVISFLKVPLACLGCMAAAVQPSGLGNSQKFVYKTFGTSGRPTQYFALSRMSCAVVQCRRTWCRCSG